MNQLKARLQGRSELGIALLLGVVGAVVLWDTAQLNAPYSQADPVGPKAVPYMVAALLLATAVVLTWNVLRGGRGEAEGGEDVDLSHPTDWATVIPLIVVFTANILLINWAGWVISGMLLFWGSAWALGSRHYVRDPLISLGMSLATFYGFYAGLGILLPAGLLEGVL